MFAHVFMSIYFLALLLHCVDSFDVLPSWRWVQVSGSCFPAASTVTPPTVLPPAHANVARPLFLLFLLYLSFIHLCVPVSLQSLLIFLQFLSVFFLAIIPRRYDFFSYTMWSFYGNLWETSYLKSPSIWEPLPRMDAQSPPGPWSGLDPMCLGISRPPRAHVVSLLSPLGF